MMRYSGFLGIVEQVEKRPGVWEEVVTERKIIGKTEQRTEAMSSESDVLPRYSPSTTVSVPARALGQVDTSIYRYVTYGNKRLKIASVVTKYPEIVLYLGGVYDGPLP